MIVQVALVVLEDAILDIVGAEHVAQVHGTLTRVHRGGREAEELPPAGRVYASALALGATAALGERARVRVEELVADVDIVPQLARHAHNVGGVGGHLAIAELVGERRVPGEPCPLGLQRHRADGALERLHARLVGKLGPVAVALVVAVGAVGDGRVRLDAALLVEVRVEVLRVDGVEREGGLVGARVPGSLKDVLRIGRHVPRVRHDAANVGQGRIRGADRLGTADQHRGERVVAHDVGVAVNLRLVRSARELEAPRLLGGQGELEEGREVSDAVHLAPGGERELELDATQPLLARHVVDYVAFDVEERLAARYVVQHVAHRAFELHVNKSALWWCRRADADD